jgi:FkbM family methyltransferase
VIAFEPLPDNFEVLSSNVREAQLDNVTLVNAAASESFALLGMEVPFFANGLPNTYMAHLSPGGSGLQVLCVPVNAMALPHPVRLVKVDAEGHDLAVLKGMIRILREDQPSLIVEDKSDDMVAFLEPLGYRFHEFPGSSNRVFYVGERPF